MRYLLKNDYPSPALWSPGCSLAEFGMTFHHRRFIVEKSGMRPSLVTKCWWSSMAEWYRVRQERVKCENMLKSEINMCLDGRCFVGYQSIIARMELTMTTEWKNLWPLSSSVDTVATNVDVKQAGWNGILWAFTPTWFLLFPFGSEEDFVAINSWRHRAIVECWF